MSDRYHFNGYPDKLNEALTLLHLLANKLYDPTDVSKNEAELKRIARFIHKLRKDGFIN